MLLTLPRIPKQNPSPSACVLRGTFTDGVYGLIIIGGCLSETGPRPDSSEDMARLAWAGSAVSEPLASIQRPSLSMILRISEPPVVEFHLSRTLVLSKELLSLVTETRQGELAR